jgi:hypothetical protein
MGGWHTCSSGVGFQKRPRMVSMAGTVYAKLCIPQMVALRCLQVGGRVIGRDLAGVFGLM